MRVALIGARGAGKSTVAPLLAARLGVGWVDTDLLVEERSGKTIPELFAAGDFRDWERRVVREALRAEHGVVALGGGAVLDPSFDAAGWTVVWLTAAPDVLARRIAADPTPRPSLTGAPAPEEVAGVIASREDRYRSLARLTFATDTLDVGDVVESILAHLR